MISKVTCVPFVFAPKFQAQILYCVSKNMSIYIRSYSYTIQISSKNIVLKYDGGEHEVTYSSEWLQVMNILNSVSLDTKKLILRVFIKLPKKLFRPPTFLLSGYRLIKEGDRAQQLSLPAPKEAGRESCY